MLRGEQKVKFFRFFPIKKNGKRKEVSAESCIFRVFVFTGQGDRVIQTRRVRRRDRAGFTLIEMLIVIILLGILAAIIIPQVSVTTEDAKVSAVKSDLSSLRSAIELYYVQHNSFYPGGKDITGGTPANAAAAATAFVQQLSRYTAVTGAVANTKDATYKYGPYVKGGALPANPYSDLTDVTCDITQTDITVKSSAGATTGWKFYTLTGIFMASDGAHDAL